MIKHSGKKRREDERSGLLAAVFTDVGPQGSVEQLSRETYWLLDRETLVATNIVITAGWLQQARLLEEKQTSGR